jgi:hypothetical protein
MSGEGSVPDETEAGKEHDGANDSAEEKMVEDDRVSTNTGEF